MDEYRALYRKYRPQSPGEVLGQEHVVRALAGAVREGKLAHAFLFSGPRGTGKTSSARILAKMVNCEKGPTPEPCGVCEQCVRIAAGTHLDVVEIDAATHGQVDDARELRDRVPTAPVQGREKVYIIDEAQRLSAQAFDALLKMFEEPPSGVRFVLATTEPHKMPTTLASRCQRFEFRRIPADTIAGHLSNVAEREGIVLAPEAGETIARASEGSVRDALSLLDQGVVLAGGEVTAEVVARLTGTPELDVLFSLADAVAVADAREVFGIIHALVQEGHDLRHFAAQVTGHFRNLLLALSSPQDPAIVDVPPDVHPRLVAQAGKFSAGELDRILSLLLQAQTDMRWSTAPRLTLELALVRAALPETDPRPAALISRIERLERLSGLPSAQEAAGPAPVTRGVASAEPSAAPTAAESGGPSEEPPLVAGEGPVGTAPDETGGGTTGSTGGGEVPAGPPGEAPAPAGSPGGVHAPAASAVDAEMLRRSWPQVVDALKARRRMIVYANAQVATVGSYDGTTLELVFPPGREFGAQKVEEKAHELGEVLAEMFGITPKLRYTVRQGTVVETEADEPLPSPEAAEELLRAQLGAEVVDEE